MCGIDSDVVMKTIYKENRHKTKEKINEFHSKYVEVNGLKQMKKPVTNFEQNMTKIES